MAQVSKRNSANSVIGVVVVVVVVVLVVVVDVIVWPRHIPIYAKCAKKSRHTSSMQINSNQVRRHRRLR